MKNDLINIEWDNVKCHICNNDDLEPISRNGEPLVNGQFGYAIHPKICKGCGLVFLSPRWSRKDYNKFYTHFYDKLYRLETKQDYGNEAVLFNIKEIWNRIKDKVDTNKHLNIMDVGCGYGFGLKYLKEQVKSASLFGIESSPESISSLQSEDVGAKLVTDDFDSDWDKDYIEKMDLIIIRHVYEHLLNPIETLKKLRKVLKPGGLIYFAVPDMVDVRTELRDYKYWWEYIFRSVHTYYYSPMTFQKTLEIGKLYPVYMEQEKEEIWCLVGKNKNHEFKFKSMYKSQLKIFNSLFNKNEL